MIAQATTSREEALTWEPERFQEPLFVLRDAKGRNMLMNEAPFEIS